MMSIFLILHTIVWILALAGILLGRASPMHKIFWSIIILLFPCIGLLVYLIFGRDPADAN